MLLQIAVEWVTRPHRPEAVESDTGKYQCHQTLHGFWHSSLELVVPSLYPLQARRGVPDLSATESHIGIAVSVATPSPAVKSILFFANFGR